MESSVVAVSTWIDWMHFAISYCARARSVSLARPVKAVRWALVTPEDMVDVQWMCSVGNGSQRMCKHKPW